MFFPEISLKIREKKALSEDSAQQIPSNSMISSDKIIKKVVLRESLENIHSPVLEKKKHTGV